MSQSESDARWHLFWAVVVVISVIFPIVFGIFLVIFQEIPLFHPVVIGIFALDFVAIMIGWHYSLKYVARRSKR